MSSSSYLTAYNALSLACWGGLAAYCTYTVAMNSLSPPPRANMSANYSLHSKIDYSLRWIQSLAILEIAHAAAGIVRASVISTTMQVFSRLLIVWAVFPLLPRISLEAHVGTCALMMAWCPAEIIRFLFHITSASGSRLDFLVWLRYSAFLILYPLGVTAESFLVYNTLEAAKKSNANVYYLLCTTLFLYMPGLYILYSHMLKQRKKVLYGSAPDTRKDRVAATAAKNK